MATSIQVPTSDQGRGNLTNQSSATTNLYLDIDEGTASPNDSDYVQSAGGSQTVYFGITVPSDVGTVTGANIAIRCASSGTKGDIQAITAARIYKSDKSTALTDSMSITSTSTITTFSGARTLSGPATKADWTGAVIAITYGVGTASGAKVTALQNTLTYTASATGGLPSKRRRILRGE